MPWSTKVHLLPQHQTTLLPHPAHSRNQCHYHCACSAGFMEAWLTVREQVLQQVTSLMKSTAPEHPCQILVTGEAFCCFDVPLPHPMFTPGVAAATSSDTLHVATSTDILPKPSTVRLRLAVPHALRGLYCTPLLLSTVTCRAQPGRRPGPAGRLRHQDKLCQLWLRREGLLLYSGGPQSGQCCLCTGL